MAPENLSGIPPQVTLSGLDAGPGGGGFSGATQQGLGGAGGFGGLPFGGTVGPDLLTLLQALSGAGGDVSAAAGAPLSAGIGAEAFGQGYGGVGAGSFGQTQPGYVAGQSSAGGPGGEAQQAAQGSADPFAIIQKFLGTAGKLASAVGQAGTSSPTQSSGGGEDLSLTGPLFQGEGGGQVPTASPTLADDLQGALGSPYLSDPTLGPLFTQGLLTGSLTPTDLAQIGTLPPDQLQGLRTALFEGGVQSDLGSQLLGGQGAGGFTLGTGNATPTASPTNLAGALQGGVGGALGLTNLLQAIQSGNVQQGIGGGLQGIGGLSQLLQSTPQLAGALGIGGDALGAIGQGSGTAGSLLGLVGGIQSMLNGQYGPGATQLASSLVSAYPQLASALNATAGTTLPGAAGAAGSALGGAGLALAPFAAISAGDPHGSGGAFNAAAALSGVAAPIAAAIVAYFGAQEESRARRSGWWNNPLIGNLYEAATRGVGATNTLADQIRQAGIQNVGTESLLGALQQMNQQIFPYYAYLQGGARPVSGSEAAGSPGMQTKEEYAAAGQRATQNVYDLVSELSRRGVTPQQLGALQGPQGNQNWGETYLGGTPVQAALAPQLAAQRTPEMAFQGDPGLAAIQSGSWLSPTNVNTVTGGPVLSMLAALNPALYGQVGGRLSYADPAVQAEIARQQEYANMINQQALQEFTSGGG